MTQKFVDSLQTTIADLPTLINEFKRQHPQQITSDEILRDFPTFLQNWIKSKVPLADNVVFLVSSLEEEVKLVKKLFSSIRSELRNCVNIRNAEKRIIKEYLEEINDLELVQRITRLRGNSDDPTLPQLGGNYTQSNRNNATSTTLRSNGANIIPSSSSAFRPITTPVQEIPLRLPFRSSGPPQATDSYQGLDDTSENDDFDERLPNTTPRGIVTNRVAYGTRNPNVTLPQLKRYSRPMPAQISTVRPMAAPTTNNENDNARQYTTARQRQTRSESMNLTPILESESEAPRLTTPEILRNDPTAILRLSPPRLMEGTLPIQPIVDNLAGPSTSKQAREREEALRRVISNNRDIQSRAPSAQSIAASSFARELEEKRRYRNRSNTIMDTDRESPFRSVSEARDLPNRSERRSGRVRSPTRSRSNSSDGTSSFSSDDASSQVTNRSRTDVSKTTRSKSKVLKDRSQHKRSRKKSSSSTRRSESPQDNLTNQVASTANTPNRKNITSQNDDSGNDDDISVANKDNNTSTANLNADKGKNILDEPEVQRLIAQYRNEQQRLQNLLLECENDADEERESLIKRIKDITKEAELARIDAESIRNSMAETQQQADNYRRELEAKRARVDAAVNSVHDGLSSLYGKPVANLDDVFAAVQKIIDDLSATKMTLTEFPKMLERLSKMNARDERDRERIAKMQSELVALRADLDAKNSALDEAEENLKVYAARLNAKIEEVQRLESLSSDQADSLEQISATNLDLNLYKKQNQELRDTINRVKSYVQKKEKLVRNLERNYLESVDNIIRNIIGALRLYGSYHYIHDRYQKASNELKTYVAETFTPIVQQEPITSLNKTLDMIALDMIRDVSNLKIRETLPAFYKEILSNVENQMPEYNQESEKEYFRIFIHTLREVILDALNLRTDGSLLLSDRETSGSRIEFEGIREQDYNAAVYGPGTEDLSSLRSEAFKDLGLNEDDFKALMPRNQYAFDSRPPTVFESTSRLFLQMGDVENSLLIPDSSIAQPTTDIVEPEQNASAALASSPQQQPPTTQIPSQQPQSVLSVTAVARSPINIIENVMIAPPNDNAQQQQQQQATLPPIKDLLPAQHRVKLQQQELQNQLMREQLDEIERRQQQQVLSPSQTDAPPSSASYEMSLSSESSDSSSDTDSDITSTRSSVVSRRSRVTNINRSSPVKGPKPIIQPARITAPSTSLKAPADVTLLSDQTSAPPKTPRALEDTAIDDPSATRQTDVFSPYLWGDDSTQSVFTTPRTPRVDWSLELLQAEYGSEALQQQVPTSAQQSASGNVPVQVPSPENEQVAVSDNVPTQQAQSEFIAPQLTQPLPSEPTVQEQDLQPQFSEDLPSPSQNVASPSKSSSGARSKIYETGDKASAVLKSGAKKMNRVDGEVVKQQKSLNQRRREESRNNALNAGRSFDFDAVITSEDDQINATLQLNEPKTLGQFIAQMLKNENTNPRTLFSAETQQRILDAAQSLIQFPQNPVIIQAASNAVVETVSGLRNPKVDIMDFDKSLNYDIFATPLITVLVYMFWILYPHLKASDYVNHVQYIVTPYTDSKPFINIPRFAPPMVGMDEPTAKAGAERVRTTLKELSRIYYAPVALTSTASVDTLSVQTPPVSVTAATLPSQLSSRNDDNSIMEFNIQPVVPIIPVAVDLLPSQLEAQIPVAGSQQSYQQQQLTELQTQQQQNPMLEPTLESQLMPLDTDSKVPKLSELDTVSDSRELVQRAPRRKPPKQTGAGSTAKTGARAPRQSTTSTPQKTNTKSTNVKSTDAPTTKTSQRTSPTK